MAWKVLAVNPHPEETLALQNSILESIGVKFRRVTVQNDAELIAVARDADVLVPMRYPVRAGVIRQLEKCRLIPSGGIGFDHIDAEAATRRGILGTNMAELFVEGRGGSVPYPGPHRHTALSPGPFPDQTYRRPACALDSVDRGIRESRKPAYQRV